MPSFRIASNLEDANNSEKLFLKQIESNSIICFSHLLCTILHEYAVLILYEYNLSLCLYYFTKHNLCIIGIRRKCNARLQYDIKK